MILAAIWAEWRILELYTRWVELGAFQPILRLHSTKNPYHERRPWGYDAETFVAARAAMQLRHAMIPYLYSMAWRYHRDSIPPILPMYYEHTEQDEAYSCPNQFQFGDQLVVAPFITPKDADTRLSRSVVWLPDGDWYDFFNGQFFPGDGWQTVYGNLRDIPVFAKAGAVVPQGPMAGWDNIDTPSHLVIHVFPGADGKFDLYEDESNTNSYLDGAYAITPMRQDWSGNKTVLTVGPAEGETSLLPVSRQVDLVFRGFNEPEEVEVLVNGTTVSVERQYDEAAHTLSVVGITLSPTDQLIVSLRAAKAGLANREDGRMKACLRLLRNFKMETNAKHSLSDFLPEVFGNPAKLARHLSQLTESQVRALMETITGAGVEYTEATGEGLVLMWNNHKDENVIHQFALARVRHWWRYPERYPWANEMLPRFQAYRPKIDFGEGNPWLVKAIYYGMDSVKLEGK